MSNDQASQFNNVEDLTQGKQKPTHYLNLHVKDADGVEHRVQMGVALGGKSEKRISPALIKAFEANNDIEFTLVGRIKSAETEVAEINFG